MKFSTRALATLANLASIFLFVGAKPIVIELPDNSECTILVAAYLEIPGAPSQEPTIRCEFDDGMIYNIQGTAHQKEVLKQKFAKGEIASGVTNLGLGKGAVRDENGVFLPPGLDIAANVRQNPQRRKLGIVQGDKTILVVRVTDSVGKVYPDNAALMSDNIFGTNGDPVNLKSQLSACSHGKLNVIPAPDTKLGTAKAAPGTIEVTISIPLEGNDRFIIEDYVTQAVKEKLGYDSLSANFHHVMYILEKCYGADCDWAGYAYIYSWLSVFQGNYYFMTGVQMHEFGHSFGLADSWGLDGNKDTDHTCMMGYPLYSDDVGKMCFNPAKNWQLGWYNDSKIQINPVVEPSTIVNLVGIAEYNNRPNNEPVVVKLETGQGNDYFIGFNRATGANAENVEADDEVTIIQVSGGNGEGFSRSYLRAHLRQNESYTITNFAGTGMNVIITANLIDIRTNPGYATVSIVNQTGPTAAPTSAPTSTAAPSLLPSLLPSNSPSYFPSLAHSDIPSDQPSSLPSSMPSDIPSDVPSDTPSDVPSNQPSLLPSLLPSKSPSYFPSLVHSDSPSSLPTIIPSSEPSWLDDEQCKMIDPEIDYCAMIDGRCKLDCEEDEDFVCIPYLCSYDRNWDKPTKSPKTMRELKEREIEIVDVEISTNGKTERKLKATKAPKSSCACRVPKQRGCDI